MRIVVFCLLFAQSTAYLLDDDTEATPVAAAPRKSEGACSDERLRKLMHQGMSDGASESKRGVNAAVAEAVGGSWAVICAECNFSYLAHSTQFCVHSRYGVTCLLYRDE